MKQNEMFRKKGMLIIMMMLSCLNLCAYTYHFKCDYQGVRYNVNFTSRQAWASGLSSPITTTDVTIQSFTLTGSQIKEIYGNSGNFTIDGEAVDANATYSFETKEIANQAFKGSSVTSVSMDNSVTTIGSLAFQNCSSLQTVQLGNQVKTIEFEAFEGCRSLKNVQLSQSLETIGIQAFKYCSSLQTIHIPSKVQLIDSEAFMYSGLTSVTFAEGCPLTQIKYRVFSDCTNLISVELPGKVENVGSESFYGCKNLQSIKFPSSLLKLENYSVFRCPNLTEVYCSAENVPTAGGYAFFMANNESFTDQTEPWEATLYVPASSIDAYKNANVWRSFGTILPIPDGSTYLVTGITLNQNTYSLNVGESYQLTATIAPNYATNKEVTWSSSNTNVATVSTTGLVTAKIPGTATITCTAKDGSGVKATCSITVNNILVTKITLNSTSKSLDVGNTYQLTATVTPSNATNKGVTWSSSNTSVATVSTTGLVTAKSPGSATITCTAKDGSGVKATCAVTVKSTADAVTVRAQDYARYYGSDNPSFTYYVLSGTINSGEPVLSCSATKTSPVGPYEIIIERGTISNDSVKLVNGTLTVMKASLTISVGNYTKIEGEENPTFTPVFTGFRNGENNSVLTVQPTVSCEATKNSPAGTYTITVSGAEANNYNITYRSGTLTILPKSALDINETNFPDAAFREYVSGAAIDKDQNGRLSDEEIAAVKTINVNNQDIYDLKGIEFFTALTTLNCRFTKMTAIDVSQNTALTDLDCRNNNFTALDVTRNTALVSLKCARNKITALDVSKNTKLTMLRCNYNQLTALNVSKCTQLQRLDCFGNKIGKTAMDNLIASLPSTTNGAFYVIDTTLDSEENVCTTDQVAAAKAKGWTVYDYNNNSPVEYAGSTEQELGDLNGDNAVNGTDLVMQTTMILAGQYNAVADMNHDGVVNGTDYVLMVNKILGVSSAPMLMAPASEADMAEADLIFSE